jgi:hypothetical protein
MLEYDEKIPRTGKRSEGLVLQWGDRLTLESWSRRPEFPRALRLWARAILACAEGKTNVVVATEVGVSQITIGKWRRQFVAARRDNGSEIFGR